MVEWSAELDHILEVVDLNPVDTQLSSGVYYKTIKLICVIYVKTVKQHDLSLAVVWA